MKDLKITLIQSNLHWEEKKKNLLEFSDKISSIEEETDLIILPEMFSTGYTMNASAMAESMNGLTVNWMKEESVKKKCTITGSIIIQEGNKFFNRLIWIHEGTIGFYNKRHLFSHANEDKIYTRGEEKILMEIRGWKIMPLVCYDLRFPVWSRRTRNTITIY